MKRFVMTQKVIYRSFSRGKYNQTRAKLNQARAREIKRMTYVESKFNEP